MRHSDIHGNKSEQDNEEEVRIEPAPVASDLDPANQCDLEEAIESRQRIEKLILDNRFDEALVLAERRHDICGRLLSGVHPETLRSLCDLGKILGYRGRVADSEATLRTAESQQRQLLGPVDPELGLTLIYLAEALQAGDRLHESALTIDEALGILRATNDEHPVYAQALRQKAKITQALGAYERAEVLFREALAMSERTFGPNHVEFAESLLALGDLLRLRANYSEAERSVRAAMHFMRDLYGSDHAQTAQCLTTLGMTLYEQGNMVEAEQSFRNAIRIFREPPRNPTLFLSSALNTLARIMMAKGDFSGARTFYEESSEITGVLRGRDSLDMAAVLFQQAECAREEATAARSGVSYDITVKRWNDAAELYQRALEIRRQNLRPDHPLIAASLEGCAVMHQTLADYVRAGPLYEEALAVYRQSLGDVHAETAKCRRNYGTYLRRCGSVDEAEDMLKEAVRVRRLVYHANHISVADALYCLSNVYRDRGDWANVERTLAEALSIAEAQRPKIVGGWQERSRFTFSIRLHDYADGLARAQVHLGRFADALTSFERGTSRLLLDLLVYPEEDQSLPALPMDSSQSILFQAAQRREAEAAEQIAMREAELAAIRQRSDLPDSEKHNQAHTRIVELRKYRERLRLAEAEIASFFTNAWPEAVPAQAEEIRSALRPDELLLDYRWTYQDIFLLIVPPPGTGHIECLQLAESFPEFRRLSELAKEVVKGIRERDESQDLKGKIGELRDAWLPPLAMKHVARAKRLIVVPSGGVRDVPLEVLLIPDVNDAAADRTPAILYSESASLFVNYRKRRELADIDRESERPEALVVASPSFAERVASAAGDSKVRGPARDGSTASLPSEREAVQFLGEPLATLPAAHTEALAIAAVIRGTGCSVTMLTADRASLANLESNTAGKRFVHIATHGLLGKRDQPLDAALALVGAASSHQEEGFLTLERLFRSWSRKLDGCEVVTLAACETNRGFSIGDSAMNLANGFLYAGAHSVVASLWSVDEEAVSLLMPRFYENLLGTYGDPRDGFPAGTKMYKAEALHEAKMWLRRRGSGGKQAVTQRGGLATTPLKVAEPKDYAQPYYWAPFILVGDAD